MCARFYTKGWTLILGSWQDKNGYYKVMSCIITNFYYIESNNSITLAWTTEVAKLSCDWSDCMTYLAVGVLHWFLRNGELMDDLEDLFTYWRTNEDYLIIQLLGYSQCCLIHVFTMWLLHVDIRHLMQNSLITYTKFLICMWNLVWCFYQSREQIEILGFQMISSIALHDNKCLFYYHLDVFSYWNSRWGCW